MKKIIIVENEKILNQVNSVYNGKLDIFVLNNNNQKEILKTIIKHKSDAGIHIDKNLKLI